MDWKILNKRIRTKSRGGERKLPSIETVKSQISRLSKRKMFLDSYEVEVLPDFMDEHETILLALKGSHLGLEGTIFCTEERILFIYKGLNDQRVESIQYHDIEHVYHESNGFSETMELFKTGKRFIFSSLMGDDAKLLEQLILERKKVKRVSQKAERKVEDDNRFKNAFESEQYNNFQAEQSKKRGVFSKFIGCLGMIFLLIILMVSCTAFMAGTQTDNNETSKKPVDDVLIKKEDQEKQQQSKANVQKQEPKKQKIEQPKRKK
jgi:hypothetical protein